MGAIVGKDTTTIQISKNLKNLLVKKGKKGDSYEEIILRQFKKR